MKLKYVFDGDVRNPYYFQFLWGWNVMEMNQKIRLGRNFQFLWGWNNMLKNLVNYVCPFRLSIPLRMKLSYLNYITLCHVRPFNSFEDETYIWFFDGGHHVILSIPLRMKLIVAIVVLVVGAVTFQFLWGWNLICNKLSNRLSYSPFNSFEDETKRESVKAATADNLSIPLRMKLTTDLLFILIPVTFNSFEDETDLLLFSLLYSRG